jgi:hypothetical protein
MYKRFGPDSIQRELYDTKKELLLSKKRLREVEKKQRSKIKIARNLKLYIKNA